MLCVQIYDHENDVYYIKRLNCVKMVIVGILKHRDVVNREMSRGKKDNFHVVNQEK